MLLIIIAIVTCLLSLKTLLKWYRLWKFSKQFDGPPALPIIGNSLQFIKKTQPEILDMTFEFVQKYDRNVRIWLGPELTIFIHDPKDVEAVLSSHVYIDKSSFYRHISPWLNTGLLLSTGEKWHKRRKALTPAFHFQILEQFVEIFERQGNLLIDVLRKYNDQTPFEFYPLVTLYALDVICETAMGTTVNAQRKTDSAYVRAVKDESHVISQRFSKLHLNFDFIFKRTWYGKQQEESLKILHDFTTNVIQRRRQELQSKTDHVNEDEIAGLGVKKKEPFLDVLLKIKIDGKPLSDADIREEVDTFMFEGHDTTTSAITFTLYNLAKYPDIQRKCYDECVSVMGNDKTQSASYSDLAELNYLDKVIKETLRLYPSVPGISRLLLQDAHINGNIYPAGSNIVLHFYSMGRNPKLFKDPLEFQPERFDKENLKAFDTFAYVPFSAGPRNCIGQKFAIMEIKSVVSKILRNYHIELVDPNEKLILQTELILRSVNPILFRITERIF